MIEISTKKRLEIRWSPTIVPSFVPIGLFYEQLRSSTHIYTDRRTLSRVTCIPGLEAPRCPRYRAGTGALRAREKVEAKPDEP